MNNGKITIDWNIDGILLILLILFIVLKVTGVISWSWGIVLLPLWILLGIIGVVCFLTIVVAIIVTIRNSKF
jgi:hypothetical protein